MTTSEVARFANVAESTVRWWERVGKLKAQRTGSGMRLFAKVDVEALTQRRNSEGKQVA